jgi:ATP-binding cassette subfamily F protein uup
VASPRRKLSYKDQRELESLPALIEGLESERSTLEALVSDSAFYARPHTEVRATLARLADLGPQIEQAYARWASLEYGTDLFSRSGKIDLSPLHPPARFAA